MSPKRFKFEPAVYPDAAFDVERYVAAGANRKEAEHTVARMRKAKVYRSDTYQVVVDTEDNGAARLSIRRIDRAPIHDWREMQGIKNAILGDEAEAVELYPAESRLVDTANQYWLFALPAGQRFPFGFEERRVTGAEEAARFGAKQRDPAVPGA